MNKASAMQGCSSSPVERPPTNIWCQLGKPGNVLPSKRILQSQSRIQRQHPVWHPTPLITPLLEPSIQIGTKLFERFIFVRVYVDWDYSTMVECFPTTSKGSTKNVSVSVYVYVCDRRCLWNLELWDSLRFGVRDCCKMSDVGVETRTAWTPNLE